MSCGTLISELRERGVIGFATLQPKAAVTGAAIVAAEVELSAADVERAFVCCQDGRGGDEGNASVDFDEFCTALALCGQVKYEEVEGMSPEQRVKTLVATFLGEQDEVGAVSAAVAPATWPATGATSSSKGTAKLIVTSGGWSAWSTR